MNDVLSVSSSSHRARTREVQARLAEKARELGAGGRLPTASQLCAELGTSARTLSDALAGLEREGLVERVRGVGLFSRATNRHGYIALLCEPNWFRGAAHSPFWDLLLEQFSVRARVECEPIETHFLQSHHDHGMGISASLKREILEGRVRGVLNVGVPAPVSHWLEEHGVPVVAYAGVARSMVVQDGDALVRMGVQELARQGCRRIALWAWNEEPEAAFREEMSACDLPVNESFCSKARLTHASTTQSGHKRGAALALEFFGSSTRPEERPDGVVISDDTLTEGALPILREFVGGESPAFRIATHANRGSSLLLQDRAFLTLLEMDVEELVKAMFDVLEHRMNDHSCAPEIKFLLPRLILPACQTVP